MSQLRYVKMREVQVPKAYVVMKAILGIIKIPPKRSDNVDEDIDIVDESDDAASVFSISSGACDLVPDPADVDD